MHPRAPLSISLGAIQVGLPAFSPLAEYLLPNHLSPKTALLLQAATIWVTFRCKFGCCFRCEGDAGARKSHFPMFPSPDFSVQNKSPSLTMSCKLNTVNRGYQWLLTTSLCFRQHPGRPAPTLRSPPVPPSSSVLHPSVHHSVQGKRSNAHFEERTLGLDFLQMISSTRAGKQAPGQLLPI